MSKEIDEKAKILLDLAKKTIDKNNDGGLKGGIMMGRPIPLPSFSLKPKTIVAKPKTEEEK